MKQTKNIQEKKTLKAFLSEHQSEILGDSIKSIDDAMRILDSIDSRNVLATAKSQEVLTKMFETLMDSDSEAKKNMPTGINKMFTELADAFRKIYRNVTGKTLMPERIAEAYAGFLTNVDTDEKIILRQSTMSKIRAEEILAKIDRKKPFNTYSGEERLAFATKYTDKSLYNIDTDNPNVLIFKKINKDNKKLGKELIGARKLASFGYTIYMLPEVIPDINGMIVKGKKIPDALVSAAFVDFKNLKEHSDRTIQNEVRKGKRQADVIFLNLPFVISEEDAKLEVIRMYRGSTNKASYENKSIIFSSSDGEYYFYEIKNGVVSNNLPLSRPGEVSQPSYRLTSGLESVNNDILQQENISAEERVADKATASIPRVNTFASFSETDVTDMIDAGVFVPEALLDKFATNSVSSRRRQTDP